MGHLVKGVSSREALIRLCFGLVSGLSRAFVLGLHVQGV